MAAAPEPLYSPAVLSLAVELARYPLTDGFVLRGDARSVTCGSSLKLGLNLSNGNIAAIGLQATSCAVGQASAAIMASGITGKSASAIADMTAAVSNWLKASGAIPDWPRLELLRAAHSYPARHGAILLPWNAACAALSKSDGAR